MIELKPVTTNSFHCPECQVEKPTILDAQLHSVYSLAECRCTNCGLEFYQTIPLGHCVDDTVSIRKSDGRIYTDIDADFWIADLISKNRRNARSGEVKIRKIVNEQKKEVVILNTLDYLYGHVLLKLYNYQNHVRSGVGLIVIVPKAFEWLAPAEASEVWVVDLSLGELAYEHPSMTEYFKEEFKRFDRIWLSMAYSHPDFTRVDMKSMTGIAPFNLDQYTSEPPTITFVLREDRWWLRSKLEYALYRIGRRFPVFRKFCYEMINIEQDTLVKKTIRNIRKQLPNARFFVTGIGENKGFGRHAMDSRTRRINEEKELEWIRIYSSSHIVIGFHGSNMLMPTAFAAGCIEVLPEDRYGNFLQDISVRYNDRRQSFFYRFADQYASPKSVASKAISMIRDYNGFNNNMCRNQYHDNAMIEIIDLRK
jgi:hypothetical protein